MSFFLQPDDVLSVKSIRCVCVCVCVVVHSQVPELAKGRGGAIDRDPKISSKSRASIGWWLRSTITAIKSYWIAWKLFLVLFGYDSLRDEDQLAPPPLR